MERLLILTGPTAVGKTALSLSLARDLHGEIISADSMQVYRGMDIGTDKIRPERMAGIPHHLIDILEPTEPFNVCLFQKLAMEAASAAASRGHLPIVVGGTGFYIQALLKGVDFTDNEDGGKLREKLMEEAAATDGPDRLYQRLLAVDPEAAAIVHKNNIKRVVRALEFHALTGEKISAHNLREREREAAYDHLYLVLTDAREKLYERIDRRVEHMMAEGLPEEVQGLLDKGLTGEEVSMQGLGYRQIVPALRGEITMEEAVRRIKRDTRHFAKRQLTWFRREKDVIWLDRQELADDSAILEKILTLCAEKGWG